MAAMPSTPPRRAPAASGTGLTYAYGSDLTADIQTAVDAAATLAATVGKATLLFEPGVHIIAAALTQSGGYNAQVLLPNINDTSSDKYAIELRGAGPHVQLNQRYTQTAAQRW